jgi:hypothetical protein
MALQRIRTFRLAIQPILAAPLNAGNLAVRPLHATVLSYLLVPLYDESQLHHPLLSAAPGPLLYKY